jgi:hypothetical protein
MVSGITPSAREDKWIVYFGETPNGKGAAQASGVTTKSDGMWNYHPYGARSRRNDPTRRSPFHDLNGFEYHPNWLHNLLIASSMGGHKL